jgi:hypothetical protein
MSGRDIELQEILPHCFFPIEFSVEESEVNDYQGARASSLRRHLTADFNGDGAPELVLTDLSTNSVVILLNARGVKVALLSSSSAVLPGQQVTVSATVAASTQPNNTPTGAITFFDGNTALGVVNLDSNGTASLTTSFKVGAHSVFARYGGDAAYRATEDFTVSVGFESLVVRAGQTATATLTIAPMTGGFNTAIRFTCSGLPTLSACTFSPAVAMPGNGSVPVNLAINTTAPLMTLRTETMRTFAVVLLTIGLPLVGLVLGEPSRLTRRLLALALLAAVGFLASCGGSGSQRSRVRTPAGTYTVTVTANGGNLQHSTNLSLTVQ